MHRPMLRALKLPALYAETIPDCGQMHRPMLRALKPTEMKCLILKRSSDASPDVEGIETSSHGPLIDMITCQMHRPMLRALKPRNQKI